ncbi:MAG: preprotein translocase subunit YajC [Clostridia bacterium]|nr:preprotein translocase subunit YajC [Clostridia bacterium]
MIIFLVILFAAMYFLMIRPQKKQQKKDAEMRNNLSVGDDIITIGGIMGKIVTIKEDSVIIETGSDKSKMRILRSAISRVESNNAQK